MSPAAVFGRLSQYRLRYRELLAFPLTFGDRA
jgi:hypothetical protein